MFLSPEEAKERLESPDNLANIKSQIDSGKVQTVGGHSTRFSRKEQIVGDISIRPFWNGGRRMGDTNVPQFIREIAGVASQFESTSQIAKNLNLSKSQVDQYKEGNVTPGVKSEAMNVAIEKSLAGVRELAISKLMASMSLMSEAKLDKLKATELSRVAADMAKVVQGSASKKDASDVSRIIVFAPESKQEINYTTIEVNT